MDPIYFCQMLTACRFNDIGDAKITKAEITPKSGPRGNVHVLPSSLNTLLLYKREYIVPIADNATFTNEFNL